MIYSFSALHIYKNLHSVILKGKAVQPVPAVIVLDRTLLVFQQIKEPTTACAINVAARARLVSQD